jgi:alcohol dehydrogenase
MPMKFEPRAYDFILPTKIRYGKGAAESLPDELERDSIRSVLVITDRVIREQPFTAAIISSLSARGTAVSVYDGVEANPKDSNVEEAAKQAAACKAGALIAIGGGSPIDCAKAVRSEHTKIVRGYRATSCRSLPSPPPRERAAR